MLKLKLASGSAEYVLSLLESEMLNLLWKDKKLRVRELHQKIKPKRKVALTSVAVLLDRLYQKKIVGREIEKGPGGYHYIYFPATSKEHYEERVIESAVNKIIDKFGSAAINYFNQRFSSRRKKRSQ